MADYAGPTYGGVKFPAVPQQQQKLNPGMPGLIVPQPPAPPPTPTPTPAAPPAYYSPFGTPYTSPVTPAQPPRVYLPTPVQPAPQPPPVGLPDFRSEYGGVVANPGYYGSQPPPVAAPSWQEEAFYTPPVAPPAPPPSFAAGPTVGQTGLAVANMLKTGLDIIKRETGAQSNAELLRRYGPDIPAMAGAQLGEWAGQQIAKLPESVKSLGAEALRLANVPFEKVSEPIVAASWGQLPDAYFKLQEQQRAVEAQAATARRAGDWQRHAALTAEAADINRQRQALNAQLMPARRTMSSAENIQQATDIIKAAYGPQQQDLVEQYRQTAPLAYQLLMAALLDPLNVADVGLGATFDAARTARAAARLAPTTATVADVAADMSRAGARGNNIIGRLSPFRLTNQSLANGLVNQASDMVPRLVEGGGVDLLGAFIRNPDDAAVVAATGGISASKPAKQTAALLQRALGPDPTDALQKIVIAAKKDDIATVADLARTYEEAARSFFPVGDPSLPARIKGNVNNWLSVTFMGYNPGYAFRNASNNLVTALADGVSPFQTTDSIRKLWLRWGQPPIASKQGIGSAGDVWKSRETATEWIKSLSEPLRTRDVFKGLTLKSPTLQLGQNFERLASERIMAHHVNKFWGQVWPKTVRSWRDDLIKAGLDYQQAEYYSRRMAGAMNPAELRAVMGPPSPRPPAAGAAGAAAVPPGAAPTMGPTAPAAGADLARTVPPDVLDALQATNDPGLVNAVQDAITAADNPAQAAAAVDVVQQIAEQAVDAERAIGEITAAATSAPITDRTAARDFFLRLRTIEQDFITEHRQRTQQVWQQARGMRRDQADMLWEQYWQTTKQQLDRFYTSLNDAEETVGQQMGMTAQAITRAQDYRRFTVAHKDAYIKKLRETWGKSRAAAPEARDVIWDEFYKWSDQHYALKATRDIAWTEQRITDVEEALWNLGQKGAPNVPPAGPEPAPPAPARQAADEVTPAEQAKALAEYRAAEAADTARVTTLRELQKLGQAEIPGVRFADAETAGRMAQMRAAGQLKPGEWEAYVKDLWNSNKINRADEATFLAKYPQFAQPAAPVKAVEQVAPKSIFAAETTHNGTKMRLIGDWQDMAGYYAGSDGNAWAYQSGKWSNQGPLDDFVTRFASRTRGRLFAQAADVTPASAGVTRLLASVQDWQAQGKIPYVVVNKSVGGRVAYEAYTTDGKLLGSNPNSSFAKKLGSRYALANPDVYTMPGAFDWDAYIKLVADRDRELAIRGAAKPGEQIQPAPVAPAPAARSAGPVALGKETTAYGINDPNQVYNFRYKVVSLDDLIPSHTDSLQPNPAFPPELQPRLRDRVGSQAQIDQIARTLNPEALIDDVRALDRGPMIVGPDNVVESGNGRTLALRKARVENGQRWKAYQERLLEDIATKNTYDLNLRQVTEIKDPVLVRERVGTVDRAAFAAEANQAAILAMSPYEQALQDAKRVRDDLLAGLRVGDDQTVEQALRSPTNSSLVKSFMETVPANERAALMDQYGNLNATGLQRIKAALFAKTYPGAAGQRLTQAFFESLDPGIRNIEAGMFGSLPKMGRAESLIRGGARAAELALADDLAAAVDMYARLKQQGLRISDYLAQGAMFEAELTPFQTELLGHLNEINRSPKKVRELLNAYADAVEAAPPPAQISMFEDVAGPTKEGIYEQIRQAQAATIADAGPLFTDPGPAPTRPAFGSRGTQLAGSPGSLGIVAPGTQQAQAAFDRIASIFDDLRRHMTAGSQPVAPLTPAQAAALRTFIEQQAIPAMVRDKTLVGNLATTMRNFALGDYSHKRNIHEWLSYIMPWSYWYTFTYWNWAQRLAQHPSMLANYARYRSVLHNANQEYYRQITGDPQAEMPEYWDRQIRLDVGGTELWLDLEKTLMPLQALTSDFKARARGAAPGGEFLEALSNYGPALWPPLIWAYAAWLKQNGFAEAAAEWVGYLTPMDRPIKGLTALAREYIPGADKLIPAGGVAPTQLLGPLSNVQGGDIWERRRIGYYLYRLLQAGQITPEQFQEAAYRQSGPAWEQAQQAEAVQRAPGNLAGYLLGQGFKPRTDADIQIDRMWKDWGDVWDKRDTLTPDQWRAEMQAFEARYPWAETVRMSRQYEQEDRLGDYAGLVLDRLGIGRERRANLAASGLTDDLLTKFYEGKYSTDLMTPQEKLIFQGSIEQLGGTLPVKPPAELTAQQQASAWHQRIAEQAVNILNARGGTTYTVDQLREIEAGYYAEGIDQKAYLAAHPELKAYWDAKRQATTTYGGSGLLPKLPATLQGPGGGMLGAGTPAVPQDQLRASEDEYYTSEEQLATRAKYGDDILDLQGLYLGLNDAQRRAWRIANPAAYARLKAYWNDENPSTSSGRSSGYSGRSYSSYRRSYTPRTYYRRSYSSYGGGGGGALPGATPVATDTLGPSGMIGFDASTLQDFEPLYATVRAIDPAFDQLVQLLFGGNIVDLMRRWYAMTPEERAAWQQTHGAEYTRLLRFYTWLTQQRDAGTTGRGTPFARQLGSLPNERPGAPLMPPPVPPTGSWAPVLPPSL